MTVSRRSALSVLGLGAASTIAPEDMSKQVGIGTKVYFGVGDAQRIATALRKMADDIDAGGMLIQSARLESNILPEDFLAHDLTIKFVMVEDQKASS